MKRTFLLCCLASLTAIHDHCQELSKLPAFEVAAITPCKPGTPPPPGEHAGMVQWTFPGGRFQAQATTVKFLIEWAYQVLPFQVSGGPSWLDDDRYDIEAKASGPAKDADFRKMAQRLLAERFQVQIRHEVKDGPVLVLVPGKTAPKLYPPKDEEKYSLNVSPKIGDDGKPVSFHVVGTRFSIDQLNHVFAWQLGRVIVNQTGLQGEFDFTLDLTPDETSPNPLDGSHVINAMRDQLGLNLKTEKAPIDSLVIESAARVTAGN